MKKTVFITGASSGIGAGLATYLAQKGMVVICTYNKNQKGGRQTMKDIEKHGGEGRLMHLDVTSEKSVLGVAHKLEEEKIHIDILIHNAGIDKAASIEDISFHEWKDITSTKIDGAFLMVKYILPLLQESQNPHIIFIGASLAEKPDPEDPAYSVALSGMWAFAKAMAIGLAKYNIRVNTIAPGPFNSNLAYWKELKKSVPDIFEKMAQTNPLKRNMTIADIGRAVEFIVQDEENYFTGNTLYLNGGTHLKFY